MQGPSCDRVRWEDWASEGQWTVVLLERAEESQAMPCKSDSSDVLSQAVPYICQSGSPVVLRTNEICTHALVLLIGALCRGKNGFAAGSTMLDTGSPLAAAGAPGELLWWSL
jgi:hypothetical protein